MNKTDTNIRYHLVKIDLLDSFPLADFFDDEKYTMLDQGNDIGSLVQLAVGGFKIENPNLTDYKEWIDHAEDGAYEFVIYKNRQELLRTSTVLMDPVILGGLLLALEYHKDQTRKGDGFPYLEHPLEVANLLWKQKFPAEVIASGYCHDLLEETDCPESKIREACGEEVLRIVKAVSNDESLSDLADWEKKKAKYIKSVKGGGEKAIAVSIADKIANLNSFFDQYAKEGPALWQKFNRGKDKKVWFENEVLVMAKENWKHPLISTFESLISKLKALPE